MNYSSGEIVKLGGRVSLGDDSGGEIVFLIDTNEFSPEFPEAQWRGFLKKGVMIHFPQFGLIHYENEIEPDVKLIARKS